MPQWLREAEILHSGSTVVELGCGITGLLGIILAATVSHYLLTDQSYVMKALRDNVQRNATTKSQHKKRQAAVASSNLRTMALDWEIDSPATILQEIPNADHVDLVIVCDCVYNEHLVQPLVQTLFELCNVGCSGKAHYRHGCAATSIGHCLRELSRGHASALCDMESTRFSPTRSTSFRIWIHCPSCSAQAIMRQSLRLLLRDR